MDRELNLESAVKISTEIVLKAMDWVDNKVANVFKKTNKSTVQNKTVNKNKCLVVAQEIQRIGNGIEVETFPEGLNQNNAELFVNECDVVLDEIEFRPIPIK